MKILIPFITLLQITSAHSSLVGIMDSGTDITHKDLAAKIWVNPLEKVGNVDYDHDGLPGDVYGWDFISNNSNPYDAKYNYLITDDVKTFFNYYSKYETRTVQPLELQWLKDKSKDDNFMNIVNFVGGYIHGTHVAGISSINANGVKLLAYKVIPTVYNDPSKNLGQPQNGLTGNEPPPPATIEEFKKDLIQQANQQVNSMLQIHTIINSKKVDVVNQSFGIGYNDATNMVKSDFNDLFKRDPTDAELKNLLTIYFRQLLNYGTKMYQAAPNTMFVVAAGNDGSNIDQLPDYPSRVVVNNKVVVAATNGQTEIADFSNFGINSVDVAAPGVAITSTAPMNNYIPLSGTSQATPFVTNTLAQMKDANPKLSINDLKNILFGTVDVKPWLQGKVRTSGIVNKERAIKAAAFANALNISAAIAKAKQAIPDVSSATLKSFKIYAPADKIEFRPARASLLIKK